MRVVTWLPGPGWRDGHWDSGAVSPAAWAEADLVRDVVAVAWRECERRRIPTEVAPTGTYLASTTSSGTALSASAPTHFVVFIRSTASASGAVFGNPRFLAIFGQQTTAL